MRNYHSDGSGRDLYIGHNNGGLSASSQSHYHNAQSNTQWLTSNSKFLRTGFGAPRKAAGAASSGSRGAARNDSWSTTSRSDFKWPSQQPKKNFVVDGGVKANFSIPRNKEFVYPSGILFQYPEDIAITAPGQKFSVPTIRKAQTPKVGRSISFVDRRHATKAMTPHGTGHGGF